MRRPCRRFLPPGRRCHCRRACFLTGRRATDGVTIQKHAMRLLLLPLTLSRRRHRLATARAPRHPHALMTILPDSRVRRLGALVNDVVAPAGALFLISAAVTARSPPTAAPLLPSGDRPYAVISSGKRAQPHHRHAIQADDARTTFSIRTGARRRC